MEVLGYLLGGLLLVVLLIASANAGAETCPQCGERSAYYAHRKKGGARDLRYKVNPLSCRRCGWSQGEAVVPTVESRTGPGPASAAKYQAAEQRAGAELKAARAQDQALREERAARFKAEAEEGARREAKRAEEEARREHARKSVGVALQLLKYVALADRRVRDEERLAAVGVIERCFPGYVPSLISRDAVIQSFDLLSPDVFSANDCARAIGGSSEASREAIYAELAALASADGKVSTVETERLAILRSALGLDPAGKDKE